MAKTRRRRTARKAQQARQTNWLVVGGVVVVGIIALFGLFYLALREPAPVSLAAYCDNNPGHCLELGASDAPVTLVEVSDYGCSHCADFNREKAGTLESEYIETNAMRWLVVPFALRARDGSYPTLPTAVATMCANDQGAFPEFHAAMFEIQNTPQAHTAEGFLQAAEDLNLNLEAFSSCISAGDYADIVLNNIQVAQSAGVNATPTFFINGTLLSGNQPLDNFVQRIEANLNS